MDYGSKFAGEATKQQSAELKDLILRLYGKESSDRLFEFAKRLYSNESYVSLIGPEPNDWYKGHEAIIRFYEAAGSVGLVINVNELEAYEGGIFGWVVDCVTAILPGGDEIPVRHTYPFHKEKDRWKIVHTHISVGIPDESLGI